MWIKDGIALSSNCKIIKNIELKKVVKSQDVDKYVSGKL